MFQKHQDLNGKIFHELSTSGIVHYDAADATPLYIILAGRYLEHSGDTAFIRKSWPFILKALDYCYGTDTDGDRLIENTNVGHGWEEGGHLFGCHTTLDMASCWDNRYVVDYLTAEVLSPLPISVQEFLVETSILDQLYGPLCESVTGMLDRMFNGQYILEWLERADLFVAPVDEQQQWYRYHQLFQQLLRDRLKQLRGPAETAALHRRASAWFAANGYLDEALQHALNAGDPAAAMQIVGSTAMN